MQARSLFRSTAVLASLIPILTAIAPPASAELGDVLHSIPCAGPNTSDLAWVDGVLYQVIFAPTELKNIYRIDPETGAVLGTVPFAGGSPQGLAYDGRNLWQSDITGDTVYKLDPVTGAIRDQWLAPGGSDGQPLGLGWDGENLWLADSRAPEKIWLVDTTGVSIGQIPAPGASPYGLAWAGGFVWVSDNNMGGTAVVYKLDPADGTVLASFACPGGGGAPNGITHDGEDLWIADNTTDAIYRVDDGIGTSGAVEPASTARSGLWIESVRADGASVTARFGMSDAGPVRARLWSVLGRSAAPGVQTIGRPGVQEIQFPTVGLASGVYLVALETPQEARAAKVWIVR